MSLKKGELTSWKAIPQVHNNDVFGVAIAAF